MTTESGAGTLASYSPMGGEVRLSEVRAGETVVIRTNYYPAWTASAGGESIPLFDQHGQLAFFAPRDGTYAVALAYPHRRWLLALSLIVLAGAIALTVRSVKRRTGG